MDGGDDVLSEFDGTGISVFPVGKMENIHSTQSFFATFLVEKENFLYLQHELTECVTQNP